MTKKEIQKKLNEAQTQIDQYIQDPLLHTKIRTTTLIPLIIIYSGWDLLHIEQYDPSKN